MKRVLIIDDETIVRVALRSMQAWEKYGYRIEEDFVSPKQALAYLEQNQVELIVTDMKMPDMNGIAFLEQLNQKADMPVTIVLSGYNEFELVREAFKQGAYDYLLKTNLNEDNLEKLLENLNQKVVFHVSQNARVTASDKKLSETEPEGSVAVVLFEIMEFQKQLLRFMDNQKEELEKPFLELARQIPRVAAKARIESIYPSRYVMYYRVSPSWNNQAEEYKSHVLSVVKQLQAVWKDYMNLDVSAAVSVAVDVSRAEEMLDENIRLLRTAVLFSKAKICTMWADGESVARMERLKKQYQTMVDALYAGEELLFEPEKKNFLKFIGTLTDEEAVLETLSLLSLLALKFREYNEDFGALFPEEIDYEEKLSRVCGNRELELWLNNYFRWVLNYCSNRQNNRYADLMLKAKRFVADNYRNPELTLGNVAEYVGLNEKYFSSKFTKEVGATFSSYLTEMRIQKAKELLRTTHFKMYEISDSIGYSSVEHFNRMFKRECGVSPRDFRKQQTNI